MRLLGTIAHLQIQRRSLTIGTGPDRYFDPAGLLAVTELFLTPGGACAPGEDGSCIIDVHHAAHPFTRGRGENFLSLGFARHYDAMRTHFGAPFPLGSAAENIIVDGAQEVVTAADLAGGFVIETHAGTTALQKVVVATPCLPFARFVLRDREAATAAVKEALQFLDHGRRGFYCTAAGPGTAVIRLGDRVFAA